MLKLQLISSRGNEEVDNAYDYHLHLNNYLPTYNVSETDQSDEQTPMLGRSVNNNPANGRAKLDTCHFLLMLSCCLGYLQCADITL